ncbi:MAG: coproporphyrinogen dehydrogenase HemZ, partial [Clostridia bacterium]|nr:coproporphyrinogen dehydrogenase HemZ [Clostridia bacterium]
PTRCLYCSFVSADLRYTKKYVEDYVRLLGREIEYSAQKIKEHGLNVQSVYFGGGTPTSLSAEALDFLLTQVQKHVDLTNTVEFCVEAGRPDTITKEKLETLKKHGVTRISINPQTMNDKTLEAIGRAHSAADICATFALARSLGFENINTDLIVGLPMETEADFAHTLSRISELHPENITVHTMSVKRGSALHQKLGDYSLTNPDTVNAMLTLAQSFMQGIHYEPYYMYRQKNMLGNFENVGYTKPGCESIYNINIMEEVQTILALGGSASSKFVDPKTDRIERIFNFKSPIEYINRFDEILKKKDDFFAML